MEILDKIKYNYKKGYISVLEYRGDRYCLCDGKRGSEDSYATKQSAIESHDLFSSISDWALEERGFKIVDTIHITELTGGFKESDKFKVKGNHKVRTFKCNALIGGYYAVMDTEDNYYMLTEIEPFLGEEEKNYIVRNGKMYDPVLDVYKINEQPEFKEDNLVVKDNKYYYNNIEIEPSLFLHLSKDHEYKLKVREKEMNYEDLKGVISKFLKEFSSGVDNK